MLLIRRGIPVLPSTAFFVVQRDGTLVMQRDGVQAVDSRP